LIFPTPSASTTVCREQAISSGLTVKIESEGKLSDGLVDELKTLVTQYKADFVPAKDKVGAAT